ncbi:cuticle protein 19-like isoform X2 [Daphnia pulex]|uniref:cuticle protein 19-like isoform X2 n=1 Tax=Daphnia pulex TaxID=6669 RepID=UPI001EDF76D2|nr:cuticle protein 19-like isoform X2 [Daphnia pulex]
MKVFILAALVAVVASEGYQYTKPAYSPIVYPTPAYPPYTGTAHPSNEEYVAAMPYNFAWAVKDQQSYNDYAHQENADGKGYVSGSYRTLLPDGRTQTVTYKADDYTGYIADVKYDGEAKYQEYKAASYRPAAYPSP